MKLPKDFFKVDPVGYPVTSWGSHWNWSKSAASRPGFDDALKETGNEFTGFRLARKEDGRNKKS